MGLGRDVCDVGASQDHILTQPFGVLEGMPYTEERIDQDNPHDHVGLDHTLKLAPTFRDAMPKQKDSERDAD